MRSLAPKVQLDRALALTVVAAVAALAALPSCQRDEVPPTSSPDTAPAPSAAPTPKPRDPVPPEEVEPADAGTCSGKPGELYALTAKTLGGDTVPLCRYAGKVLMIVNTASQCGYTYQLAPLQDLYGTYGAQGFAVLGFPSDSFNQELDTAAEVSTFCTTQYKITFPMFAIGAVKPPAQPVFAWIYAQPGYATPIAWNFEKFLVGKDGKLAKRFLTAVPPDAAEVKTAIEAELAK